MQRRILIGAVGLAVSALAFAASDHLPRGFMERLDVDHDGHLSQSEAKSAPRLSDHFAAADRDHDGVLSRQEVADFAHQAPRAPRRDAKAAGTDDRKPDLHMPEPATDQHAPTQ